MTKNAFTLIIATLVTISMLASCKNETAELSSVDSSVEQEESIPEAEGPSEVHEYEFHGMGESVRVLEVGLSDDLENEVFSSYFEYTITGAKAFENFEDSGIDSNNILLEGNGSFVLIDFTMTNINTEATMDDDTFVLGLRLADGEDNVGFNRPDFEVCYFSGGPEDDETGKEGYYFSLPIGETINCQVGFWMSEASINRNDLFLRTTNLARVAFDIDLENQI